ncbi:uncharacterized protein LOC113356376 [Papaver somniferum]|uniref:uncharacterized protein LOC113356376 n=1 Tax=Papaver somniferum TaxID=3469 RepID=UPI000E6F98D8|nr:uncharacterized protein LOC113356376 [Papaver somniferum]
MRSAKDIIRKKYIQEDTYAVLWRKTVHPNLAAENWKIEGGACATLDKVQSRFKINLVNRCYLCKAEEETLAHILWHCHFAAQVWDWITSIFNLTPHLNLITCYKAAKGKSRMIKDIWLTTILVVRAELRLARNKIVYEKKTTNLEFFKKRVFHLVNEHSVRSKSFMHNSVYDLSILNFFRVHHRRVRNIQPLECFWSPPPRDVLLLCCDGAAKGNPGRAGAGVVARDADCNVVGAMSIGLGVANNYMAELFGILVGLEWVVQWGMRRIIVRSDSISAVTNFSNLNVPWMIKLRWEILQGFYDSISFEHTYREANFAADIMAKRGCLLRNGQGFSLIYKNDAVEFELGKAGPISASISEEAEALGLLQGAQWAMKEGMTDFTVEGDCKNLFDYLNEKASQLEW